VAEVLAELDVQSGLEDLLGQASEQPTRPGQLDTLRPSSSNEPVSQRRQIRCRRTVVLLHISDLRGHA